jgi:HAE1 family hydrophobic/amphiphilic exporter-1
MWFTRVSIKHPVFAVMMMMSLVVLGIFGYRRLAIDQFPDVNFPIVVVQTTYPGASPETVEAEVTRKLEEVINTVSNIDSLTSRSYEGNSVILVQFDFSVNTKIAAQEIREKIALIRSTLRDEVKDPTVSRFDPASEPILSFSVSSSSANRSARELSTISDRIIKNRLSTVSGVGSVYLVGDVKREVHINVLPERMASYGIGMDQVMSVLRTETQDFPVGNVRNTNSDMTIQLRGRVKNIEDFKRLVVANKQGLLIRLSDVAQVEDAQQEVESLALLDNKRIIGLEVLKAQGENTVAVVNALKDRMAQINQELPDDVKLSIVRDSSVSIQKAVDNVSETIYEGAILTVLIVFLFLGSWRSTVITALTLPIAILGTYFFMYALGFTINMVTLMCLSLCVGLLIDDAIVVRENIVRHNLMGKDHYQASLEGTQEIGLAVLATTMSIVAVFLPIGFMGGIIGQFFHQFGLTVVVAILISMFVSFTLDPMLSSVWHDPDLHGARGWVAKLLMPFEKSVEWISDRYQSILAWSLKHRWQTVLLAFSTLIMSFMMMRFLGSEFVPAADYAEGQIQFETPQGSSIDQTERKLQEVLLALKEFPEIVYTYTTINTGAALGSNSASIFMKLTPKKQRKRSLQDLTQPLRERLSNIAGISVTGIGQVSAVGSEKPIEFSILGSDIQTLRRLGDQLTQELKQVPGLVDLDSNFKPTKPTFDFKVKRDALADFGLSIGALNAVLQPMVSGTSVTVWRSSEDETYDVRVRIPAADRMSPEQILSMDILLPNSSGAGGNGSGRLVKLSQLVELEKGLGSATLYRKDLQKEIKFDANVYQRSAGEVASDIEQILKKIDYPPGYSFEFGGSTKDQKESAGYALSALLLAVIFIYMILASQFNSFLQPIAIMSSLPLTLIGVVGALLIFKSTLNLFSMIGVVMLMGLATKNAILLVDYANQMRREGVEKTQALLNAARVRLRPILMTTLAMVFGMLPLALGLSEGSEQRAPLGQSVIGGVITSSILTLVVVPVIYSWLDDLPRWFKSLLGKVKK